MAQVLIVAATHFEIAPLAAHFAQNPATHFLITGVGMTNTAYKLGKYLATNRPKKALHLGIAGSFDQNLALGQLVEIVEDSFSELGAEDKNGDFLDMQNLGFSVNENPLAYNTFIQPFPSNLPIPKVTAITVNTVHGKQDSIEKIQKHWNKQIETMESAAFFQIMHAENLPFYSFRTLSNYVEPRDRANWQIPQAIQNLNASLIVWIEENLDS